jgi:integrase
VPKVIMPAFSIEDVRGLLRACRSPRDTAIVLCLLDSGCRAAEFCALRVQDVDLRSGSVRVIHGKGGKDRTCYLGAKARQALVKYLRARPLPPDRIGGSTGTRLGGTRGRCGSP